MNFWLKNEKAFGEDFPKLYLKRLGYFFLENSMTVSWLWTLPSVMDWMLDKFAFEARRTGKVEKFKIWKDDNHPIDLTDIDIIEKIDYIHDNPVRAGLVDLPEHYLYSSARDYTGGKGLVNVIVV